MYDAKAALANAKRDEIVAKYALASSLGLLMRDKD
jgi:outer membrane protein TolC